MTITEKLRHLTEGRNKAEIASRAGLKPTTISDYVSKGYTPRADIALKMARALDVPVEWLIDDSQGLPVPARVKVGEPGSDLTDAQLMRELRRRQDRAMVELDAVIDRAEKTDWAKVQHRIVRVAPDAPIPDDLRSDALLPYTAFTAHTKAIAQFELKTWRELARAMRIANGEPPPPLDEDKLTQRFIDLFSLPDFNAVFTAVQQRTDVQRTPEVTEFRAWYAIGKLATGEISPLVLEAAKLEIAQPATSAKQATKRTSRRPKT